MEHRFWKDFGRVLEGFWEAQILDFRIFFVIFSMQILECKLEGQKIEKNGQQDRAGDFFKGLQRYERTWGEGLGWGEGPWHA